MDGLQVLVGISVIAGAVIAFYGLRMKAADRRITATCKLVPGYEGSDYVIAVIVTNTGQVPIRGLFAFLLYPPGNDPKKETAFFLDPVDDTPDPVPPLGGTATFALDPDCWLDACGRLERPLSTADIELNVCHSIDTLEQFLGDHVIDDEDYLADALSRPLVSD